MYDWDFFEDIPAYHPIADANNLYDSFQKARKGSHWKGKVQKFRWNLMLEIRRLQIELDNLQHGRSDSYELSPYSRFIVHERGKTRAITALSIRDRVVKHALNDVILLPKIRPYLSYDNGASLKGKGVSFTRKRIIVHLKKYYREYGTNSGCILIIDFSGYYDNIDHEEALKMVHTYVQDDFAEELVRQAFDSYQIDVSYMSNDEYEVAKSAKFSLVEYRKEKHTEEELTGEKFLHKSLSVGDQTSQITAIMFATPIDNLIKIVKGFQFHARYMDDTYVISKDTKELIDLRNLIYNKANELKILINQRKVFVTRIDKPFTFLQFRYCLTKNGHVVVKINPKTLKRMRCKLKKLKRLVQDNKVEYCKVEQMFKSWIANFCQYMSKKQIEGIILLYRELFGNNLDKWLMERNIYKT